MTNTPNALIMTEEGARAFDGAGVLSDVANLIDVQGPWESTVDGVGLALDVLGLVANPLDAVLAAGLNWLIEHISFLKEPVDFLLGDPHAVTALAGTWQNVANHLHQTATDFTNEAKTVSSFWTGEAALSYLKSAETYVQGLQGASALAEHIGQGVTAAGILVSTVRGLILDAIVSKIVQWIPEALSAVASAVPSLGSSLASCAAWIGIDASVLAIKITTRLEKLAATLARFSKKLDEVAKALHAISKRIDSLSPQLNRFRDQATTWNSTVDEITKRPAVKIGKKLTEEVIKAADTKDPQDAQGS
jgi:uncharacterized protein YukE